METGNRSIPVAVLTLLLACLAVPFAEAADGPKPEEQAPAAAEVKKISLAEFEQMRAKGGKDVVVLDVRTEKEFAAGRVPGAVHINWRARDFSDQVGKLDKTKKYLVYCLAGVRSKAAAERMRTQGFTHLYEFSGGWDAYEKAGQPVEK